MSPRAGFVPAMWVEVALVCLLFALGSGIRLFDLAGNPPGLFRDEAEKGYTALELATTGRHGVLGPQAVQTSRLLPVFIEVYQGHDRTSAVYQYAAAPFVGIFGLNVFTTRFPAAMAGILLSLFGWLYVRRALGPVSGLFALAFFLFHPTGIAFSRWAQQGILALLFTVAGFFALAEAFREDSRHRRASATLGALLLLVACYAYDPFRLVIPLYVGAWLVAVPGVTAIRKRWSDIVPGAALFVAGWVPLLLFTLGAGSARLSRVGVFSEGWASGLVTALTNYLAHFRLSFLLVTGDANPRHGLPAGGILSWGCFLFCIVALVFLVLDRKERNAVSWRTGICFLLWCLLAPAAAAFTNEGIPHALRALPIVMASAMLAAYGAGRLVSVTHKWHKILMAGTVVLLIADAGWTVHRVASVKSHRPNAWERGIVPALTAALDAPGRVYLSGAVPYASYFALFAEKTEPEKYHSEGLAALRTQVLAPGETPDLEPGDVLVAPPRPGLPEALMNSYVVIYRNVDGALSVGPAMETAEFE